MVLWSNIREVFAGRVCRRLAMLDILIVFLVMNYKVCILLTFTIADTKNVITASITAAIVIILVVYIDETAMITSILLSIATPIDFTSFFYCDTPFITSLVDPLPHPTRL
jgi:hypothetical protein